MEEISATVVMETSSSASSSEETSPERKPVTSSAPKHRRGTTAISSEVAAALDRTRMSDRAAARVLIPFGMQMGQDISEMCLSPSAIRASRSRYRSAHEAEVRASYKPECPLVLHWDGKLMADLMGRDKIDRLAILVTGDGMSKILAIPKLPDSKAERTAIVIIETIENWDLGQKIKALCFDTTATNTGIHGGVCVRVEQALGREMIYFACRHHVLELLLEAVFSFLVGDLSKGPEITIFQSFRNVWPQLKLNEYSTAADEEDTAAVISPWAEKMIHEANDLLKVKHPRDDYKELLELVVIFLGGVPHGRRSPVFMAPGALHRARWMARGIYSFKIWMFRYQFTMHMNQCPSTSRGASSSDRLISGLRDFCLFVAQDYVLPWFSAREAASAPRSDLALLQKLQNTNAAGYKSFNRHLWYLNEVNVSLALFDPAVDDDEKRKMVENMNSVEGSEAPPRRVWIPDPRGKTLADFCSSNTYNLFTLLDLPVDFLQEDPSNWENNTSFGSAKIRVDSLNVVNDAAERGIALIQEFTKAGRTRNEEQMQFMIQIVEEHRKVLPTASKATLMKK